MKKCKECNIEKPLDSYYRDNSRPDGYQYQCKQCKSTIHKKIYVKNQEKIKEYSKEYFKNNKIEHKKRTKQYQENNKEKLNKYRRQWYNETIEERRIRNNQYVNTKYHSDERFKIEILLRSRFQSALKNKNLSKSLSVTNILGCSIEEYKRYLENKFLNGMTWENHGKVWEIDHIKPCDSFNLLLEEQQKECFNFKNTQPLFKTTEIAQTFGYNNQIGNKNKLNKII